MHEDAICQHRRDYTYTVPYVLANPICATRDHEYACLAGYTNGEREKKTIPLSNS